MFGMGSQKESIFLQTHLEERGDQILSTIWDAWDNKINYLDFKNKLNGEVKLIFYDSEGKYFNWIAIYHNWLAQKGTYLIINKTWDISI